MGVAGDLAAGWLLCDPPSLGAMAWQAGMSRLRGRACDWDGHATGEERRTPDVEY